MTLDIKVHPAFQFFVPPPFPPFPLLMELDYSFLEAAKRGDIETIENCLKEKPNVINVRDAHGKTALHYAAVNGDVETIETLLNKGADRTIQDEEGKTALIAATIQNHIRSVQLLLFHNFSNGQNSISKTQDKTGKTAFHYAANCGNNSSTICSILLQTCTNEDSLDVQDSFGRTALHYLVENGIYEATVDFLRKGANPNIEDRNGETPFFIAVRKKYRSLIDFFLENQIYPLRFILSKFTILHYLPFLRKEHIEKIRSQRPFDFQKMLHTGDGERNFPIHVAVVHNNQWALGFLLNAGANINSQNSEGDTALHLATKMYNETIIRFLLVRGAKKNIPNNYGQKVFDIGKINKTTRNLLQNN